MMDLTGVSRQGHAAFAAAMSRVPVSPLHRLERFSNAGKVQPPGRYPEVG